MFFGPLVAVEWSAIALGNKLSSGNKNEARMKQDSSKTQARVKQDSKLGKRNVEKPLRFSSIWLKKSNF